MWQLMNVVWSQVGLYLADGWEPFAVLPGEPLMGALVRPELVVFLKRRLPDMRPLPTAPDPRLS